MLINPAYAQTAQAGGGDMFGIFMPMILIFAIMYFLLIRPQQKKQKQHQAKLAAVKRGDKVVTGGGIYGTVRKVSDEGRLQVEIAKGIEVEVASSTLMDVVLKPDPQAAAQQAASSGGFMGKLFGGGKKAEEPAPDKESKKTAKDKDSSEADTEKPPKKKKKKAKTPAAKKDKAEATDTNSDDSTTETKA